MFNLESKEDNTMTTNEMLNQELSELDALLERLIGAYEIGAYEIGAQSDLLEEEQSKLG